MVVMLGYACIQLLKMLLFDFTYKNEWKWYDKTTKYELMYFLTNVVKSTFYSSY